MLFGLLRPSQKILKVRIKLSLLCFEEGLLCILKIKGAFWVKLGPLYCPLHLFGTVEEPRRIISKLLEIEVHLDLNRALCRLVCEWTNAYHHNSCERTYEK